MRPDLREITDSSYIDPITDDLVRGNPGIVPAESTTSTCVASGSSATATTCR